jgi:hypothetical protein
MGHIPEIVFLIIGLSCLRVLLSIRSELRKITHQKKRSYNSWSFEDQLKLRVKYLHQCRRFEEHLNSLKPDTPANITKDFSLERA